jgi:hypothetical protein
MTLDDLLEQFVERATADGRYSREQALSDLERLSLEFYLMSEASSPYWRRRAGLGKARRIRRSAALYLYAKQHGLPAAMLWSLAH